MIKPHYKCPIEAAYMAKNFGVKYGIKYHGRLVWDCIGRIDEPMEPLKHVEDILDPISDYKTLYVHPTSLSIFEPQRDDIIEICMPTMPFCRNVQYAEYKGLVKDYLGNENRQYQADKTRYFIDQEPIYIKILQRNGKTFIMPQEESND